MGNIRQESGTGGTKTTVRRYVIGAFSGGAAALGVGLGLMAAASCGPAADSSDCKPGTEGCPCLGEATCIEPTDVCSEGFCVHAGGSDGGLDDDDDGGADDGMDDGADDGMDGGAGDGMGDGTDDGMGDSADDGPMTGGMQDGGPVFISFGTNVDQLTEGESVTFTAVLTDPDGIDDLIGGELTNADKSVTYGSFATSGQEGAYQLTLAWAMIDQAGEISLDTGARDVRTFRAEFFDQDAKTAWETVDIVLHCDSFGACDGACVDVNTNEMHCGACNTPCSDECIGGVCEVDGCGDGDIDVGEQCDGNSLQGFTCSSLGLGGGTLTCDPFCAFDTSGCTN